ncbi:GNAT family N-acetyltransferase [Chloroflexota bacterium]
MSTAELQVKVRPMVFLDLKAIFAIDKATRDAGTPVTYKDFYTRKIFGMDIENADSANKPDILEVAKLIDLGFVAETEGTICGFIVGRQTYLIEREIQEGEIVIVNVHPDYRGKGIGAKLMNAIFDLFRSRGVNRVRMGIEPSDVRMQSFLEREGFSSRHLLYFTKNI